MRKRTAFIFVFLAVLLISTCAACGSAVADPSLTEVEKTTFVASATATPSAKTADASAVPTPAETPAPTGSLPAEVEDNCATSISDRAKSFLNLAELDAKANIVIAGECVSAEPVFQNDMLYNLSQIKVETVFKGDISVGDNLLFVELGGRVTNGEYNKGCNLPPIPEGAQETIDKQIVMGTDWFYPMKEGECVLLFAVDATGFLKQVDEPVYAIVGDYDGKLFFQEYGFYAKPLPSETDKHVFGDDSLIISMSQLNQHYR